MTNSGLKALSPQQVNELYGFDTALVRRMCKSGTIPSYKVGRRWFVPVAALDKWLESRMRANGCSIPGKER